MKQWRKAAKWAAGVFLASNLSPNGGAVGAAWAAEAAQRKPSSSSSAPRSSAPRAATPKSKTVTPGSTNEKIVVNAMEYPWSAIGRLNAAGKGFCTGFLVGEQHILTAAHCFYDRVSNRWRPPGTMHFVAGYQRGNIVLHAPVEYYITADDYHYATHPTVSGSTNDWALAKLSKPIGRKTGWLGLALLTDGVVTQMSSRRTLVMLAGYRIDSEHILTVQSGCELRGLMRGTQTAVHTCEAIEGDSGGPLLTFDGQELKVIGIHVVAIYGELTHSGGAVAATHTGGAVATSVFVDQKRWPKATKAIASTGALSNKGGSPPPQGGPVSIQPRQTIGDLLTRRGFPVSFDGLSGALRRFQQTRQLPITGEASVQNLGYLLQK